MQLLDSLIVAAEIALALAKPLRRRIAIAAPFIQTVIWVLSPIWSQPATSLEPEGALSDLGVELEPDGLVASIKQALSKPASVVSVAQGMAEPGGVLSVPAEPNEVIEGVSVTHSIIDQEQAIIEADGKPSDKLRRLALLHGVPRSAKGKRRRSSDLRADLKPLVSVALP